MRLLLMFFIIIAAYFPTFSGEFILDDIPFVKENPSVHGLHDIFSYFLQEDGIIGDQTGRLHSGYYRPVAGITYSIDYCIWGLNSGGFRATNLVLHLLTCLLLYVSMCRVTKKGSGPLLAVLLFGLHPANTEAVAWVSSRNNILVSLFSVASFYFYVLRGEELKYRYGVFSLVCFALALLSKEFGVMLLPILFLYDRLMGRSLRQSSWGYLAFLSILAAYFVLRGSAAQELMPLSFSNITRALWFAPYVLTQNLKIALLPAGLHNFVIRYPSSILGKESLLGFAAIVLIFLLLWKWRRNRVVLFSTLAFFMSLVPVLQVFPTPTYSLVSMRWLYFPFCFLSFSAAWGIHRILATDRRHLAYGVMGAIIAYLGIYTFVLNENLWKRQDDFFQREVVLFGNYFYSGDLGRIKHLRGDYAAAERYYKIAIEDRSPDRAGLLLNYAALLVETNRPETALALLEEAGRFPLGSRSLGMLHNNRGSAFFNMKDYKSAVESFQKALSFAPKDPVYRSNLRKASKMKNARAGAGE